MATDKKNILILGCGRSGTSIFGELFDHLPEYKYYSEPYFDELSTLDFSGPIAVKVPRESKSFPSTVGLSFPLEKLEETRSGDWKIFWIVRHPLDAISSLKVGISKNWGHHPRPIDWKSWLDRDLIERCAHHWNYINTIGYEKVKDVSIVVRFEDMIGNSEAFATEVASHIYENTTTDIQTLHDWASKVQNTNNNKFIEAETSKAYSTTDHQVRVGRWKENLTKNDLISILPIIEETSKYFNYYLPRDV